MECLRALKDEFSGSTIEQGVVADIVGIIHLTRAWVTPYGMLGSNNLLTGEQTKKLLSWVDIIDTCFMYLLENAEEEAFADYEDYQNYRYF